MAAELWHYENDETVYADLVRQWGEKHGAKVDRIKLVIPTKDDEAAALGMYSYGDYMDYLDDRNRRLAKAPNIVSYTVDDATSACRREMYAIIFILNGYDTAEEKAELLVTAGYSLPTNIGEYIKKQRASQEAEFYSVD